MPARYRTHALLQYLRSPMIAAMSGKKPMYGLGASPCDAFPQ